MRVFADPGCRTGTMMIEGGAVKDSPFFVEKKIILWYNKLFCENGNCPAP